MFVNLRRIRKCHYVQLASTCFALSVLSMCWEQLDYHVVSHIKSYSYRYLVNRYDLINSSLGIKRQEAEGQAHYPYLIEHAGLCDGDDNVLLLVFVKSSPENWERRNNIRATWGSQSYAWRVLGAGVRVVFALGVHPSVARRGDVQQGLLREDAAHGDLIQQNFADTFHNLTVKLLQQIHWTHAHCARARFIMTTDDDVFVHTPNLVRYLQGLGAKEARNLWVGHVHQGAPPIRRKNSKYYVPYETYPWPSYPDYTAGAGYVISADIAENVYLATLYLNTSLYIDDVFFGLCANAMGVLPQEHAYFSGESKAPYHPCIYERMITSHGHVKDVRQLWKEATDPAVRNLSSGLLGSLYCTAVKVMLLCRPYFHTYPCRAAFL